MAPVAQTQLSIENTLKPLSAALAGTMVFSLGINLMMLVSPLYLMQVFDRVLTSGSLHTLLWLTVVAIACLAVYGALDALRGRILSKVGIWLEGQLAARLIGAGIARSRPSDKRSAHALLDLAQVRSFLSGPAVHSLFDAPWALVFLVVLWCLHVWFGVFALVSALVLLAVAYAGEIMTRGTAKRMGDVQAAGLSGAEAALRNHEVVRAMGMSRALIGRWRHAQEHTARQQDVLNDQTASLAGLSKFIRMSVQVAIIGIGALLAVEGEATAGSMIAASILLGRALAPVDQAIGAWKQIGSVRNAWRRVNEVLATAPQDASLIRLPEPQGNLALENVTIRQPGAAEPVLDGISFELRAGGSLAIVGPSGAGKSLLCRVICGLVPPSAGNVRIDLADIATWKDEDLRPHVGYLPQDVSLLPGTVADNIARFAGADSRAVVAAAQLADVHELVLRLPNGYQTDIGDLGDTLPGGQRQRIGLARAVFGAPKLVVLDEPNSNLDPAGEAALLRTIRELKRRQCTVIVVSHKLGIVQSLDKTLLLQDGAVQALGSSDKVLSILMGEPSPDPALRTQSSPAAVTGPQV